MKKLIALLISVVMLFAVVCMVACGEDKPVVGPTVTFRTTGERKLGELVALDGVIDPADLDITDPDEGWMYRWETGARQTNDKGEESLVLSGTPFDFSNVTEATTVYQRIVPQPGVGRYFIAGATSTGGPGWHPEALEEDNEWFMDYDNENEVYTQTITMEAKGGFRILDNRGEWHSLYNGTHVNSVTIDESITIEEWYPTIEMGQIGAKEDGTKSLFYTGAATDCNIELNVDITSATIVVTLDVLNGTVGLHITELTVPNPDAGPSVFGTAVVGSIYDGACGGTWFGSKDKAELESGIFTVADDVATGTVYFTNGNVFKIMKDTAVGWGDAGIDNFGYFENVEITYADDIEVIAGFLSDDGGNYKVTMPEGKVAKVVVTFDADNVASFEVVEITDVPEYILVGGGLADGELNFGLATRFDNTASENTIIGDDGELVEWTLSGVGIFKIMQTDDSDWSTALGYGYSHSLAPVDNEGVLTVEFPEGTTADTFLVDDGNFKMGIEGYTTVFTIDFDMVANHITINIVSITAIA